MLVQQYVNGTDIDVLGRAIENALRDLIYMLPRLAIGIAILAIFIAISIMVTRILRKFLQFFKIDELAKPMVKELPFSLTSIITYLTGFGIILVGLYSVVLLLFPKEIVLINEALSYLARVVSVVFMIVFVFVSLVIFTERIRLEARLRGFMFIILLFITIILVIDISALSDEVKAALAWGLSLGLGLAIGVFSAWYFFHEYLKK